MIISSTICYSIAPVRLETYRLQMTKFTWQLNDIQSDCIIWEKFPIWWPFFWKNKFIGIVDHWDSDELIEFTQCQIVYYSVRRRRMEIYSSSVSWITNINNTHRKREREREREKKELERETDTHEGYINVMVCVSASREEPAIVFLFLFPSPLKEWKG